MKEYQKPLKRKGLALFPKEKGKTARIRRKAAVAVVPKLFIAMVF